MPCPITTLKFIGTFSLGLLTGVSDNLSTVVLPSLSTLPSATTAARTLRTIQIKSTRHILSLASISTLSLLTSYWLASPRGKHPYLIWVAGFAVIGGQGIEGYFNGLSRFPRMDLGFLGLGKKGTSEKLGAGNGDEWDMLASTAEEGAVNGESVEEEMAKERWVQALRTTVAGVGFFMSVIGIWGDGA